VIMANLGSIQAAWFISLLFGAGMGSVLVLRWLWERINLYSELAAMAVSLTVAPLLLLVYGVDPETEWLRLGIMAAVSTAAAVAITFVTPATEDRVLLAFYRRVHPFGWWRRTAALAGHEPSAPLVALRTRVAAAGVAAASLFLLLLGTGRSMIPPPTGIPLWSLLAIVAGLALIPFWWASLAPETLSAGREPARGDRVRTG
jgi:solute:Na+ symporter, SSS family